VNQLTQENSKMPWNLMQSSLISRVLHLTHFLFLSLIRENTDEQIWNKIRRKSNRNLVSEAQFSRKLEPQKFWAYTF